MAFAGDAAMRILAVALAAALLLPPWVSSNSDADALSALRESLSDPDGVLESWYPTLVETPCTWFHIVCNQENRVTRVDLGNKHLSGQLVPELGNIEFLQHLGIHQNNIEGSIPTELGNLKNLISLDLYNNNLSGAIPPSLGTIKSLTILRLNDNHLTGTVPREILENPNIRVLNVANNDLSGPIPSIGRFEHFTLNNFETKD